MLAKTYHAVIPRWLAAGLRWTAIHSTPGSILPPPFVEDGPPPAPTEGGLPRSKVGPVREAGVMQGCLEGVCLGALKSSAQCTRTARTVQGRPHRQLPCPHTNSVHGLLLPLMHHKSLWCAKGLALGEHSGCGCNGMSLLAGQKSLIPPAHSNPHAPTRCTAY